MMVTTSRVSPLATKKAHGSKQSLSRLSTQQPSPKAAPTHAVAALDNRFCDPDGFYEALLDASAGLNAQQSMAYQARLILLLANQIGDQSVLARCIELAKSPGDS
jgi:hypothetical protein